MAISRKIAEFMTGASFIRKMFEEGAALRAKYGAENVIDYTLGNPLPEPPEAVTARLLEVVRHAPAGSHRYMSNAGYAETRRAVAEALRAELDLPFGEEHVVMTVGAAGGLNVVLKALLDAGDEVIILAPYFVEYKFYIDNHGGRTVVAPTGEGFELDVGAIERAITERAKAVLICTPNNPTGVVYSEESLRELGALLRRTEARFGRELYLLSDEPYRKIVFDGRRCPSLFHAHENAIMVTSHSKDLALPGERIGYVAVSPHARPLPELIDAMTFTNRTLGFVNAPAIWQRVAQTCQNVSVDIGYYQTRRDLLCEKLTALGYELVKPGGAFYLFPRSPLEDDVEFCARAMEKRLLLVPGSGFGTPGYFRIAYCTVTREQILRSIDIFAELLDEAGGR
jgi:aspartate aminotransferase